MTPAYMYYDVDTYNTTQYSVTQIVGLDKMWVINPTRTYSKYFSAKALSKQENVKW